MRVRDQKKRDTLVLQVGGLRRWTNTPTLAKKKFYSYKPYTEALGPDWISTETTTAPKNLERWDIYRHE